MADSNSTNVRPIRPDAAAPMAPNRKRRAPKSSAKDMDSALNSVRQTLFQAMGIVRMAAFQIQNGVGYVHGETDVWTSLDGAFEILCSVADRIETTETILAAEVRRGKY